MRIILPPLKWNKEIDSIDFGGFCQWMEDYERSLMPPNVTYPHDGQIWEAVHDCEVPFRALISCPPGSLISKVRLPNGSTVPMIGSVQRPALLPFGLAHLQKGEKVQVKANPEFPGFARPKPIRAMLVPLRYDELQDNIVPKEIRTLPRYDGYRLCVKTARAQLCIHQKSLNSEAYLNEDFSLIQDQD
jgi:hypothetical protein